MSDQIERLEELLQKTEELIGKFGKRRVCEKILEYAEFLNPYDRRVDIVFEVLEKYCGRAYSIKFKQALKTRLAAHRSPVSPEIIGILGTHTAYLIHEVFDVGVPLRLLDSLMDKVLKEYSLNFDPKDIVLASFLGEFKPAVRVAEKYIFLLDKLGAFELDMFAEEYAKCFGRSGSMLSIDKSIIASIPLFHAIGTNFIVLDKVVSSISSGFNALLGFCISAGYTLLRYLRGETRYYPWAPMLKLLGYSESEAVGLYQRASSGDHRVIIDMFSRLLGLYYRGSLTGLIDVVSRWEIDIDDIFKLLLSISFSASSLGDMIRLLDIFLNIVRGRAYGKRVDILFFKLLNKVAFESKPALIRRVLERDDVRRKIIEIVDALPSVLVLTAVNRIVKAYLPLEIAKKLAEKDRVSIDVLSINSKVHNWREYLDIKTRYYLGVE